MTGRSSKPMGVCRLRCDRAEDSHLAASQEVGLNRVPVLGMPTSPGKVCEGRRPAARSAALRGRRPHAARERRNVKRATTRPSTGGRHDKDCR